MTQQTTHHIYTHSESNEYIYQGEFTDTGLERWKVQNPDIEYIEFPLFIGTTIYDCTED